MFGIGLAAAQLSLATAQLSQSTTILSLSNSAFLGGGLRYLGAEIDETRDSRRTCPCGRCDGNFREKQIVVDARSWTG